VVKKVFLLAVLGVLFGCEQKTVIPENLMTEEQMVQLMIDIRIAEGQVNTMSLPSDSAQNLFKYLEAKIFAEHQVDSASYQESFNYYMIESERFLRISDIVIDSLNARKTRLNALSN
jgi:hypothetical protein